MNMNNRPILPAALASLILAGGITGPENASARTAQEILAGAALHCDAADTGSLTIDASGNVTEWGAANAVTTSGFNPPQYQEGWIHFGQGTTKRDMTFPRIDDVQTFIQVIDIETTMDAFLLGDSLGPSQNKFQFCRGEKGEYCHDRGGQNANGWAAERFKKGSFWKNGEKVEDPGGTVLPAEPCVISFIAGEGDEKLTSDSLTRGNQNNRYGRRRLAEVAIFTNKLSDADRQTVEQHLLTKWFSVVFKTWKGGDGLWSAAAKWDPETWEDFAQTVFPAGEGGTVGVDTNVAVKSLAFDGSYTLTNAGGSIAFSGPVTVAENKTAAILTPVFGALNKKGSGMLVVNPDLTLAGAYSFSGPATVQDGALFSAVTLAADAALTLKDAGLRTALAGNGTPLTLEGENILGDGAAFGGFGGTTFAAGSLTRITGTNIVFGGLGTITAGDGSGLVVSNGAALTYDHAIGMSLPEFKTLAGTVKVTGKLTSAQILDAEAIPVAKVADGVSGEKFTGAVATAAGDAISVVFTNDNGTVKMRADIHPADLVYTKKPGETAFTWDKANGRFDDGKTFKIFDNVFFQENDLPGQQVAVDVPEDIRAGRVEAGSGFTFTGRAVNAFAFVKRGAGTSTWHNALFAGETAVEGGMLDAALIAPGTLAVSNGAALRAKAVDRRAIRFLRLNITGTVGTDGAAVSELRLFRKTLSGYEKIAWPVGMKLRDKMGNSITYQGGTGEGCLSSGKWGNESLAALIDGIYKGSGIGTDPGHNKWWPHSNVALPWVEIEFPSEIPVPDGYNICTGDWAYNNRSMKDWTIAISRDGQTWEPAGGETGQGQGLRWGDWYNKNADVPAYFFDEPAAADIADVTVAAGGTLVADGGWTARLTLGSGAALTAMTNCCLTLKTIDSASAQIAADLKVDFSAYDSMVAGNHYILAGAATNWPGVANFTKIGEAAGEKTLGKDDGGYFVTIVPQTLVWSPAPDDVGKMWRAGVEYTPWTKNGARAFFRDNDNVTFGQAGGGGGVNVSGAVRSGTATFEAGTAYALQQDPGTDAKLVLAGALTVNGLVTNRVTGTIGGAVALGAGGTLVLAPGSNTEQTVSGEISGEGSLVKAGDGTAKLTGKIAHTGSFAVNAGKLVIDAVNTFPAMRGNPVTVGPGAAIRFDKANSGGLMSSNGWLLCDGGRVELKGSNPFDQEALPNFILTNGATLFADCSVKDNHLNLNRIELGGSDILISKAAKGWEDEGLTAKEGIAAAGVCSIAYQENSGNNTNTLRVWNGVIDVAAGGTLNVAVKVYPRAKGGDGTKYDIPLRKTGLGTLVAAKDADFVTGVQIEKGVLSLPREAGTFEGVVTFEKDAVIDISARTNAYAWGEKLAVPASVRAGVRAWDGVKSGDVLMTWDEGHAPDGDFALVGGSGLSLKKTATALEVSGGGMVLIFR